MTPASAAIDWRLVRAMASSAPILAICFANTANNFGDYIMMDGLPSYFRDVLGFSITTAGLLAALPQLLVIVTTLGSSWLADALSARTLSVGATRRLFSALGLAPSTLLLGLHGAASTFWRSSWTRQALAGLALPAPSLAYRAARQPRENLRGAFKKI